MVQDTAEIFDQVSAIIRTHAQSDVTLAMDTHISADLSLDSVAMFEVIMDIEDHFDIGFAVEEGAALDTIKTLVDAIHAKQTG